MINKFNDRYNIITVNFYGEIDNFKYYIYLKEGDTLPDIINKISVRDSYFRKPNLEYTHLQIQNQYLEDGITKSQINYIKNYCSNTIYIVEEKYLAKLNLQKKFEDYLSNKEDKCNNLI